jgi:hypothetical protein
VPALQMRSPEFKRWSHTRKEKNQNLNIEKVFRSINHKLKSTFRNLGILFGIFLSL